MDETNETGNCTSVVSYTLRCVLERENVDDCVVARTPTHTKRQQRFCVVLHTTHTARKRHRQHSDIDKRRYCRMKRHIIAPVAPIYDYIRVSSVFDFSNFCFSTHFPIASLRIASSLLHCTNDRVRLLLACLICFEPPHFHFDYLLLSSSSDALPPNIVLPTRCLLVLRLFSYLLMCRCCRFAIISLDGCVYPHYCCSGFGFCV